MIDHTGIPVADWEKAKAFYDAAFEPMGIGIVMSVPDEGTAEVVTVSYGREGPDFWLVRAQNPGEGRHYAFSARNRAEVDGFHAAALAAGGKDNGAPGLRPHYHPNYYAAFVIDPDGNNVEAVYHGG